MAKKKITALVAEMLEGFLAENGYELYSSEFVKEGRDWFLRVFIDLKRKTAPITAYISTEDCEKVSRYLSEKLDEADPIEQNYYLEVSSPGMDRPLITPEHYRRYLGSTVEVRLYKAISGEKNIEGILKEFAACSDGSVANDYTITIETSDGEIWNLKLSEIARTKLAVIF